ncbi:MAG: MBOAT family O-acyltransferase [Nitrosopumilaceae archaeon]
MSYTIDIYRGKLKPSKTLKEFALFVAFFPQLVAGPILRASHFLPQLREKILDCKARHGIRLITIKSINLKIGITIMTLGFLKKMFFADNIGVMVDEIFSNPLGAESFTIILGSIAFGVQIYCDFSGYSDIAIGAAKIFGFRIPINFNKPYFATSPVDFWRKWHISLSSWLRDYLYIPLGGNKKSQNRTYFNLMIVMLLGGLWHGASWNFVIWGFLHGVYLGIEKFLIQRCPIFQKNQLIQSKLGKIISILLTQYLIFMTWIAFRVEDFNALNYSLYKYVIWDFSFETTLTVVSHNLIPLLLIFTFFILHYISYKTNIQIILSQLKTIYWTLFLIAVMISILFFFDGNSQDFIYFRF